MHGSVIPQQQLLLEHDPHRRACGMCLLEDVGAMSGNSAVIAQPSIAPWEPVANVMCYCVFLERL
jgi:hypothetical protein